MQLSPLKRRSLAGCRSPVAFAVRRWTGEHASFDAARVGAALRGVVRRLLLAADGPHGRRERRGRPRDDAHRRRHGGRARHPGGPAVARGTGVVLVVVGAAWAVASLLGGG